MHRHFACGLGITVMLIVAMSAQAIQIRQRDPEWIAPPGATTKANPLADRPEAAAGGRKLFLQRCSVCHGEDGRGTERAPDVTAPDVQAQSDGALYWKISGGNTRGGMPSFSFLPELQRWQLVLHLRMLARDGALSR
ncbi:MAG TPA: c-type cytochrome [Planctomycetaceae bacterium]|nr:c-type cytochrome [Planctomycetaceae bacterium]